MENRKSCQRIVARIAAAALCSCVFFPHVCRAAPTIGRIVPAGATQGSEVEVLVFGTNLHEPQTLFFEDGIVQQTKIESVNDKQLKVVLNVRRMPVW